MLINGSWRSYYFPSNNYKVRVPYYGIIECRLGLPEIEGFQKDVLMLVIDNSPYDKKVPIQLGTLNIHMILKTASQNPTAKLGDSWE